MASIGKDTRGHRYIQFENEHSQRKTIRLGKVPKRDAEKIRFHVADLVTAKIGGGVPSGETTRWLANLSDQLREKLVRVGLCEERGTATLGAFIDQYETMRTDLKPSTMKLAKMVHKSLRDYFGENLPLRSIDKLKAKAWRLHIATAGKTKLAPNTINKRTGVARALFYAAMDGGLIEANPFAKLPCDVKENPERDYFVTAAEAAKVLDKCPDTDWRVIFALCRWGGLRCPSEVLALRWGDILWDQTRMIVRSSKTGYRVVPLFPEVLAELNRAWDEAPEGAEYVVTKQRDASANFRTTMEKIITRAGLKPWPKLFQALRASRATELADTFPGHVAAAWLGHTPKVADKFYRKVTDAHFDAATKSAALCAVESAGNELQGEEAENESAFISSVCDSVQSLYTLSLIHI